MALGAIIGGILGIAGSVYASQQQSNAAAEANALAEEQAEAQYERAQKEWKIDYETRLANWAWSYAQHEAQIFQEKQAKADYEWRQGRLIDSAMQNLAINQEALLSKYGVEEDLRAAQESLKLGNTMSNLTADTGEALRQNSQQLMAAQLDSGQQMQQLALDTNESLRQYMQQIRDVALQSKTLEQQTNRESQELMTSITLSMQQDNMQRDLQNIAAVIDGAAVKARVMARQGGSSSAQRLAKNKAQELGRTYGLLALRNQDRDARVALLNTSMQGERATKMGRFALSVQDSAERMKYTNKKYAQAGQYTLDRLGLSIQDAQGRADYAIGKYARDAGYTLDVFEKLTMPSFKLAADQGKREMQSLYIQTQGLIDEASMPFRESIFFAPRQPIAGLEPEYMAPTKVYQPTGFDLAFNAISAGIQGAMNYSYQKPTGGLGFF